MYAVNATDPAATTDADSARGNLERNIEPISNATCASCLGDQLRVILLRVGRRTVRVVEVTYYVVP